MTNIRTADLTRIGGGYRAITGAGVEARFGAASDDALSPMDMLLAALGACTAMDVHSIATKKRQRIDGYVIRVRGEQRDGHPRIYTRIDVTHEVHGANLDVDAIRRSIELSAAKYCPVSAMLSSGGTEIHHHYQVHVSADPPTARAGEVVVTGPFARAIGDLPSPRPG